MNQELAAAALSPPEPCGLLELTKGPCLFRIFQSYHRPKLPYSLRPMAWSSFRNFNWNRGTGVVSMVGLCSSYLVSSSLGM